MGENRSSGRMLAARRQELILRQVERQGSARVRELSDLLGVSPMTIRRDIDVLADSGRLSRVHGGAAASREPLEPASVDEPGFAIKSRRQFVEKVGIARHAAELIKPGSAIGLTAGTTTAQLAGELEDISDLLVVTNSLAATSILHQSRRNDLAVLVTGGTPTPSEALVGPIAEAALASLHLDQLFMGVHGMGESAGFSSPNLLEAQTLRAFVASAEEVVVLADHTKWGTTGLSSIGDLSAADVVITDEDIPPDALAVLEAEVETVIVAEQGSSDGLPAD